MNGKINRIITLVIVAITMLTTGCAVEPEWQHKTNINSLDAIYQAAREQQVAYCISNYMQTPTGEDYTHLGKSEIELNAPMVSTLAQSAGVYSCEFDFVSQAAIFCIEPNDPMHAENGVIRLYGEKKGLADAIVIAVQFRHHRVKQIQQVSPGYFLYTTFEKRKSVKSILLRIRSEEDYF